MAEPTDDLEQLQALFDKVEAAPAEAREQILQQSSANPELLRRVRAILRGANLPEPAAVISPLPYGGKVGAYRLLELLGVGGLGSVYLAERMVGASPQRVALKLLAPHASGPEFLSRFQREQHILASLDHPHITRMLDAGVDEVRQPYLAVEYVPGQYVTTYCDSKLLGVDARIELFLQVCEAVSYAHRNLVVHLDLKPSNILVSDDGVVKLLDFGTSKLISPDQMFTITAMMTPAYASPEQLRNEPVTTACDVYSLGVVLFELLAGRRPTGNTSAALLMERALTEAEPGKLEDAVSDEAATLRGSTTQRLRQALGGDLATILNKCLRPRPANRYASVDALAEDLRRYLSGRAVLARPQTVVYRVGKFVRRNRVAVGSGLAALLLVAAAIGYAGWRQQQALVQAHRAVQMQEFMTRLFELSRSSRTGRPEATVAEMLQIGAQTLPSFITDPADLRAARLSIATSMSADGDKKDALPLLLQVIAEARAAADWNTLVDAETSAGAQQVESHRWAEGKAMLSDAVAMAAQHHVPQRLRTGATTWYVYGRMENDEGTPADLDGLQTEILASVRANAPERETATSWNILGLGLQSLGKLDEAQHAYEQALVLYAHMPYSGCNEGDTTKYLAQLKKQRRDDAGALAEFERSYELERACAGEGAVRTLSARAWVGNMLMQTHRYPEAIALLEPSLPLWYAAGGKDNPSLRLPLDALARSYTATGRYEEGEAASREQLRVLGLKPGKNGTISVAYYDLGDALAHEGRYAEAVAAEQEAIARYPMATPPTPLNLDYMSRMQALLKDAQQHVAAGSAKP